ncbi:uncharacterized protein LOC111083677 [Limulus polyphemus]|uniref:Uncharacterized protein LOC111083677 n=1 Tax=Limulus polyphemus TaxID=6850 RepID=A0ABM1RXD3_LIMPO|nr:uncharacterized protein LOC111083677 [Limulus polyphemus]
MTGACGCVVFFFLLACVVASDLYGDQGGFVSSYGYGKPFATEYARTKVISVEKKTGTEDGDAVNYHVAPPPKVSSYSGGYSTGFHSSYGTSTPRKYSTSFAYSHPGPNTHTPIHQGYARSKVVTVEKTLGTGDAKPVDYHVSPPPKVSSYSDGYTTRFHSSYGTSVPHRTYGGTYAQVPQAYGSTFVSSTPFGAHAGSYGLSYKKHTPSITRPVVSSVQHNIGSFVADTLKSTYPSRDSFLKL